MFVKYLEESVKRGRLIDASFLNPLKHVMNKHQKSLKQQEPER